ncbi:transcription repressor OFP4-like [Tasmannia lanceolata]|uniref:transcription repressor OFP4-like n=1 Tax=Tasmannia lanceolata TaxID=3420 RepID=UPI00406346FD
MGNYRFRLSDMMPNAWFYKLRDMNKSRNQTSHPMKKKHPQNATHPQSPPKKDPHLSLQTNSYFTTDLNRDQFYNSPINFKASDTHFPDPPKNPKKKPKRKSHKSSSKLVTSSVSAGCSCRATFDSVWKSDSPPEFPNSGEPSLAINSLLKNIPSDPISDQFDAISSWSSSCNCTVRSSATDIIIDVDNTKNYSQKFDKFEGIESISDLELRPILTKPAKLKQTEATKFRSSAKLEEKNTHGSLSVKVNKEGVIKNFKEEKSPARKSTSNCSQGLRIRGNSPRLASRKIQAYNRKSMSVTASRTQRKNVTESFAIVKSSFDPQRDFRDSMVEMIVENNIRASKDLEELLACYLSLNSDIYHDVIIKVFEQIWFDFTEYSATKK